GKSSASTFIFWRRPRRSSKPRRQRRAWPPSKTDSSKPKPNGFGLRLDRRGVNRADHFIGRRNSAHRFVAAVFHHRLHSLPSARGLQFDKRSAFCDERSHLGRSQKQFENRRPPFVAFAAAFGAARARSK